MTGILESGIRHQASGIRHQVSGIRHQVSDNIYQVNHSNTTFFLFLYVSFFFHAWILLVGFKCGRFEINSDGLV